ncbi:CNNM domain-containing protein, partial [Methanoregula sp.]|uniref:CNNM domain-containing protein n=1 Tax=Methanoregula sp. TaxID=2052170 RepID=UPI000CC68690
MSFPVEIVIIFLLILINGIFAMAEFAIVSAKRTRLRQWADAGDTRAATALRLAEEPTRFLSTVQIGITLVGIFAGAFGGATIAAGIAAYFRGFPHLAPWSDLLGITVVVLVITYLTLIFGELVPKRIALLHAEGIAAVLAKPMQFLSIITAPLVIILSGSTEAILHLLRIGRSPEPPVSEEDTRSLLADGRRAGIIEKDELEMVEGVL